MPRVSDINSRRLAAIGWPTTVFLLALAVRLPYLWDVPRLTDETREVLRGLAIYLGCYAPAGCGGAISPEIMGAPGVLPGIGLPLTNFDPYMGAFANYLMAAAFWLFGPNPFLPRLLIAVASAAGAVLAYCWGQELGGRRAGVLAGFLLAFSSGDVFARAHTAYSNALTPLFLLLSLYLLDRALLRREGLPLVLSGLAGGVAFQTHPSAMAVLAGVAAGLLVWDRPWLRTPAPYIAAGAFLLGSFNYLLFHLLTGFQFLRQGDLAGLATSGPMTIASYWQGVAYILGTLHELVSGVSWPDPAIGAILALPRLAFSTAAAAGMWWAGRSGRWVMPVAVVSWILLFPLYNRQNEFLFRYNALMVPVLCVGVALGAHQLWRWMEARRGDRVAVAVPCLAAIVVVAGLVAEFSYSAERSAVQPTNTQLARVAAATAGYVQPGETVLIDISLYQQRARDETLEARSLEYFLSFLRVASNRSEAVTQNWVNRAMKGRDSQVAIVEPDTVPRLHRDFEVEVLPRSEAFLADAGGGNRVPVGVRLHRRLASLPPDAMPVSARLGDQIQLVGYRLSAPEIALDAPIKVVLYWRVTRPIEEDYTTFVQLIGAQDNKAAQRDGPAEYGPTSVWPAGEIVPVEYELKLKEGALPGEARLLVGMYTWPSLERLEASADDPVRTEGDALVLPATVVVRPGASGR